MLILFILAQFVAIAAMYWLRREARGSRFEDRSMNDRIEVLVVDDEPGMRGICERALVRAGFSVTAVASFEAVEHLFDTGYLPDIVLTDVVLGQDSTGTRVQSLVAGLAPNARTIYMTGYDNVVAVGAPTLRKPFTPQELLAAITSSLDPRASRGS